jgi:hypothetical protein
MIGANHKPDAPCGFGTANNGSKKAVCMYGMVDRKRQ